MRLSDRAIASLVERGDIFVWDGTAYCPITMDDGDRELFVQLHDGSYSNYPPIYDGRNHPAPGLGRPVPVVILPPPPEDETDRKLQHIAKQVDRGVVAVWNGLGCIAKGIAFFVIADLAIWALLIIAGLIFGGDNISFN